MTLDEAIDHCGDKALNALADGCIDCAAEHAQLKAWLEELRVRREEAERRCENCGNSYCQSGPVAIARLYNLCVGNGYKYWTKGDIL